MVRLGMDVKLGPKGVARNIHFPNIPNVQTQLHLGEGISLKLYYKVQNHRNNHFPCVCVQNHKRKTGIDFLGCDENQ